MGLCSSWRQADLLFLLGPCCVQIVLKLVCFVLRYNPWFDIVVIGKCWQHGLWGDEELGGGMPFTSGQTFTLTFNCAETSLRITVNKTQEYVFASCVLHLQEVNVLEVTGSVHLLCVSD